MSDSGVTAQAVLGAAGGPSHRVERDPHPLGQSRHGAQGGQAFVAPRLLSGTPSSPGLVWEVMGSTEAPQL